MRVAFLNLPAGVVFALTMACALVTSGAPVQLLEQQPVRIVSVAPGVSLIDFGRVAFGNLRLLPPAGASGKITVHFGETLTAGRIDRHPPGSVRYAAAGTSLGGTNALVVASPADRRNTTQPEAVLTAPEFGVLLPFRWVEIEGWPGDLKSEQIRRRAVFARGWDDGNSGFKCPDEMLNQVWELSRYSIKATTFAGIYVDGDRERIAYEADAYINQLGEYYASGGTQMARDTFDRLMSHPTWPSEWAPHMIFIAYADWMQTGDTNWLALRYAALKTKLQSERLRPDGLIGSNESQMKRDDLVDWPAGERDAFVFTPANTVVNAFHLRALALMAELARALNLRADADDFSARERVARMAFQRMFFDTTRGLYRDGEGTDHCSLHANLFPLAFGLATVEHREHIAQWLCERGMKCSVYAAQYLLEGLFENDQAAQAIALMTAPGDRSWRHMVESGATITWEAWDQRYKPNLDWNHAWGAAPANLLPRFVLGAQPLSPGWKRAIIRPEPGPLDRAEGKVPTALGPISITWTHAGGFTLSLALPPGMSARVEIPAPENSTSVFLNGTSVRARREGRWWVLNNDVTSSALIEAK